MFTSAASGRRWTAGNEAEARPSAAGRRTELVVHYRDFAPGARSDMRLDTLLDRTGAESLNQLLRDQKK